MVKLCEVVITAPDPDWLKDFSRQLVKQRLCASAHNFTPVQSIYRWRGEIYEQTEGRVSLHRRCDRVAEIIALIKEKHPYKVPGVSTRAITDGNPDYLAWIEQETSPKSLMDEFQAKVATVHKEGRKQPPIRRVKQRGAKQTDGETEPE